jgi:hypothetical protein
VEHRWKPAQVGDPKHGDGLEHAPVGQHRRRQKEVGGGSHLSLHNRPALQQINSQQKEQIMTLILPYKSKKELKTQVGQPLRYQETSVFGPEYVPTGTIAGANRPHITGIGREFFAQVTLKDGIIKKVK